MDFQARRAVKRWIFRRWLGLEIVRGRAWQFPTRVPSLDTVWQSIDYLPNSNQEDTLFWKGTSSGMYTIHSAWEITRPHHNTCLARDFIWHVGHIPRQAFMLWLTFNQRLQTLDRVQRIWYERNQRSFNNHFSPAKKVEEDIFQLIRAHLINGMKVDDLPPAQRLIWEV
ncbi:hypothetical protein OIU85_010686 [Salix viminalis]|uniref:Reverse transcriptase zinc-binding domain-containing protein n=1 Tax=Salix viminalis TaxID=40686 RepID=A0A9Q0NR97_SALVM|nr:hypothetical protein OIU85_010686 [Salix viminalis]